MDGGGNDPGGRRGGGATHLFAFSFTYGVLTQADKNYNLNFLLYFSHDKRVTMGDRSSDVPDYHDEDWPNETGRTYGVLKEVSALHSKF